MALQVSVGGFTPNPSNPSVKRDAPPASRLRASYLKR
jgi:hypothetical protein